MKLMKRIAAWPLLIASTAMAGDVIYFPNLRKDATGTSVSTKYGLDVNIIGGAGLGTQTEDSAHVSGDTGTFPLAVRNDAGTALAADGDYIPLSTDSTGRLRVDATISSLTPINSGAAYAQSTTLSTTAATETAPADAVGFILTADADNTAIIRFRMNGTASNTSGQRMEAGRDTGFVPFGGNLSLAAESGTQGYQLQWVTR
jgi:hypothetical protein